MVVADAVTDAVGDAAIVGDMAADREAPSAVGDASALVCAVGVLGMLTTVAAGDAESRVDGDAVASLLALTEPERFGDGEVVAYEEGEAVACRLELALPERLGSGVTVGGVDAVASAPLALERALADSDRCVLPLAHKVNAVECDAVALPLAHTVDAVDGDEDCVGEPDAAIEEVAPGEEDCRGEPDADGEEDVKGECEGEPEPDVNAVGESAAERDAATESVAAALRVSVSARVAPGDSAESDCVVTSAVTAVRFTDAIKSASVTPAGRRQGSEVAVSAMREKSTREETATMTSPTCAASTVSVRFTVSTPAVIVADMHAPRRRVGARGAAVAFSHTNLFAGSRAE